MTDSSDIVEQADGDFRAHHPDGNVSLHATREEAQKAMGWFVDAPTDGDPGQGPVIERDTSQTDMYRLNVSALTGRRRFPAENDVFAVSLLELTRLGSILKNMDPDS